MATIKICKLCGTTFTTRHNSQLYCSKSCSSVASAQKRRAELYPEHSQTQELTCWFCGKKFVSDRKKMYCSVECRLIANNRKRTPTMPKKKKKTGNTIADICLKARKAGMTYGQYVAMHGE